MIRHERAGSGGNWRSSQDQVTTDIKDKNKQKAAERRANSIDGSKLEKKGAEQKSSRSCLKGAQERKGIKKSRKQQKRRVCR